MSSTWYFLSLSLSLSLSLQGGHQWLHLGPVQWSELHINEWNKGHRLCRVWGTKLRQEIQPYLDVGYQDRQLADRICFWELL